MSIQKTTTELETLKINYLTQAMYEDALENDEIEENELYMSSYTPNYIINTDWTNIQASGTITLRGPLSKSGYYYYASDDMFTGNFPDYLKVIYNNTEYICEKHINPSNNQYVAYGAQGNYSWIPAANSIDFTNYPFNIVIVGNINNNNKMWQMHTESGGTISLQIDRGYQSVTVSSDFEQAVIYICNGGNN